MNFKIQRVILSFVLSAFFALGLVFSSGMEASADHGEGGGRVAEDVDPTNEEHVSEFLDNVVGYYEEAYSRHPPDAFNALIREVNVYSRAVRREGEYKHEEIYSLSINNRNIVTNHARYPNLFGYAFDPEAEGSDVAGTIKALIEGTEGKPDMNHCETYGGEAMRVACARRVNDPYGGHLTFIAGLHHYADDKAFSPPDCNGFELETSAEDVYGDPTDDANLEAYVKGVISVAQNQFAGTVLASLTDLPNLAGPARTFDILRRAYDQSACYRIGDLKHGNIYAFIMEAEADPEEPAAVIINGNNFDLNGTNLELNDDRLSGEQNIARLFIQELGNVEVGSSAYVNYHWDDPTTEDDNVPNFLENGKVPGTSCKRSYIEVADITGALPPGLPLGPTLYIFGSGTYPGDDVCEAEDDDGGCAIAGTAHTYKGALLNLFVMAFVLFPVVLLRRRM